MDTIATKSDYDGVTNPAPSTTVHSDDEFNDRNVELEGAVTDSSQALASADAGQLSKAMFANGVAAESMQDNGSANLIQLTPITGASGLRVATPATPDYTLLDGAIFSFAAAATNTGNVTANVGQTVGTFIGAQPLFLEDGSTEVPAAFIIAGRYYDIRYDAALDADGAFVLLDRTNTIKARAQWNATPVVSGEFNVASIVKFATGKFDVTFRAPFANNDYAIVAVSTSDDHNITFPSANLATTGCRMHINNLAGALADAGGMLIVAGDR